MPPPGLSGKWIMALECHYLLGIISETTFLPLGQRRQPMGLSKNIAYRLRTLRETAGLSQQEVADRSELSLSLIAKMEQGRKADPRASTILALAAALGVRPGQLIEDLTPPPEGFELRKGKKGKKKKKKLLAALVAAVGEPHPPAEGPTPDLTPEPIPLAQRNDGERKKKKKH
jgi:transcriptional regulator with XRE-family HTH domain